MSGWTLTDGTYPVIFDTIERIEDKVRDKVVEVLIAGSRETYSAGVSQKHLTTVSTIYSNISTNMTNLRHLREDGNLVYSNDIPDSKWQSDYMYIRSCKKELVNSNPTVWRVTIKFTDYPGA